MRDDEGGSGAKIHGIGTQMHVYDAKQYNFIYPMFEKLAATGLLVKVTELDVKVNPGNAANYVPTPIDLEMSAAMYQYIFDTYFKVVPQAQQHGLTIWGISDKESWVNDPAKNVWYYPLLWDDEYQPKPAYNAVVQSLNK